MVEDCFSVKSLLHPAPPQGSREREAHACVTFSLCFYTFNFVLAPLTPTEQFQLNLLWGQGEACCLDPFPWLPGPQPLGMFCM